MRNFGHNGQEAFWGIGINGKSSELHAAMGLTVLPKVEMIINRRKQISETYDSNFKSTKIKRPLLLKDVKYNYSYYPILLENEDSLIRIKNAMNSADIFPRRYFYPSLNMLEYTNNQVMPIAEDVSKRVLCLPLYFELSDEDVNKIIALVLANI
jgi:dTDP-4-amino-4,6-dideoxygalactose transaminase